MSSGAIVGALLGVGVLVFSAQPAGAVAPASLMDSAHSGAPYVGPGGDGEEVPDSTRTAPTAGVEPQCTVKFQYYSHGIDEALSLTVLHLVHNCADESNAYVVLGNEPFGGAEEGVDYSFSSRRIYLDDLDGTASWGFRIVDDDIFDPG